MHEELGLDVTINTLRRDSEGDTLENNVFYTSDQPGYYTGVNDDDSMPIIDSL